MPYTALVSNPILINYSVLERQLNRLSIDITIVTMERKLKEIFGFEGMQVCTWVRILSKLYRCPDSFDCNYLTFKEKVRKCPFQRALVCKNRLRIDGDRLF